MRTNNHVGIDVRMAHHSGIGRYLRGTVSALAACNAPLRYTLIGPSRFQNEFQEPFNFVETKAPIYSFQEQIEIPHAAKNVECLHIPHYNIPVTWRRKLVVTIHDLIHLHFAEHFSSLARFYAGILLPWAARRADAIITVSEYTKTDLIKTLKVDPNKITVIHHGIEPSFQTDLTEQKLNISQKPYFLCVGLIKAHKNVGLLIQAFKTLKKMTGQDQLALHLVGEPDLKQHVVSQWCEEIKDDKDIFLIRSISDMELRKQYQNAIALVFPSRYEGFGFPLLEAMASKTPVIAARATSVPEIAGENAAIYFDPSSVTELTNCMKRVLENTDLRAKLIREGLERIKLFDWKSAARKTINIYESLLN